MSDTENQLNSSLADMQEIVEHSNKDYPVGVYYVEPSKMYMGFVRWHWHEEIEINLIRSGTAEFHIGETSELLIPGQAILINSNILHSISCMDDSCVILSLLFHPSFLFPQKDAPSYVTFAQPVLEDESKRYRTFDRSDAWSRSMLTLIDDLFTANLTKDFGYELITKSYLCQLWLHMLNNAPLNPSKPPKKVKKLSPDEIRIKDAISYIENHYADQITLDDIADSIHISKSECCRCFKRAMGISPFEYLMRYRILQSAELMLKNDKTQCSISDLAYMVGFNNASYYNKLFKKYFGCTPTQYKHKSKTEHRDKLSPFGLSLSHI